MDGRLGDPPVTRGGPDRDYNPLFDSSPDRSHFPAAEPTPSPPAPEPPKRRLGRAPRLLAVAALVLVVVVGLAGAVFYITVQRLTSNIARVPNVFSALDQAERPSPIGNRVSFLIVGTDSRQAAVQRSDDVLMLARVDVNLDPDNTSASVVSIPRDSWVNVPDRGPNKIAAAYGFGGPSLLVRTTEQLTNVRIDHFAIIDFAGFQNMVDAVGGIDVKVATPTSSDGVGFIQGPNHLDGRAALAYVGQGSGLPSGYGDRISRQQNALRALLDKAADSGLLADPIQLIRLLDALSHALSVDETLSNGNLQDLGLQMRGLRTSAVQFLVAPVQGLGREGGQAVVHLDKGRSAELWEALRTGRVVEYVQRYPGDALADAPR
jgi:LCP family protein required for cell wall assembly